MAVDPQGSRSRLAVDVDASGCGDGVRVGFCYCKNVPTKSTVYDSFLPKPQEGYGRAIFIFVQIIYYSYNTTTSLLDVSQLYEEICLQTQRTVSNKICGLRTFYNGCRINIHCMYFVEIFVEN